MEIADAQQTVAFDGWDGRLRMKFATACQKLKQATSDSDQFLQVIFVAMVLSSWTLG
jgi:hypothetical protein